MNLTPGKFAYFHLNKTTQPNVVESTQQTAVMFLFIIIMIIAILFLIVCVFISVTRLFCCFHFELIMFLNNNNY